MSKVSNMINMLFIMKDKKIHNMFELSRKLEVTPRMIKQYKDELELAGIYIDSKRGINGGYILNQELNNIDIGLTLQEVFLLSKLKEEIEKKYNCSISVNISDISFENGSDDNGNRATDYIRKWAEITYQISFNE